MVGLRQVRIEYFLILKMKSIISFRDTKHLIEISLMKIIYLECCVQPL